jgi:hypothetical protein
MITINGNNVTTINQKAASPLVTQQRPDDVTAYAANDVVGTIAATNLIYETGLPVGEVMITGASLRFNVATRPADMGQFRLHLYNAAPTAINDNVAFDIIAADRDKYLGSILLPTPTDLGATLYGANNDTRIIGTVNGTIYGVLETLEAYTPTAESVSAIEIKVVAI